MLWSNFHYIFFWCSILAIECRVKFKTKACEKLRDVTFLYDCTFIKQVGDEFEIYFIEHWEYLNVGEMTKYGNEECFNVTFVNIISNINWKELDFMNMYNRWWWNPANRTDPHTRLKESLQLYEIETKTPRTLVFFSGRPLRNDIVDILYRLQDAKNTTVILASFYTDIFQLNQIPRHRRFMRAYSNKPLIDVIKNPNFDRFEFSNHLPSIKEDRSCLKSLTVILMISINNTNSFNWMQSVARQAIIVNSLNNYNHEITVRKVIIMSNSNGESPLYIYSFLNNFQINFTNISSLDQINETGILSGNNKKIFLFFDDFLQHDNRGIMNIKSILKNNRQVVIETSKKDIYKEWYNKGLSDFSDMDGEDNLFDLLVNAVCK